MSVVEIVEIVGKTAHNHNITFHKISLIFFSMTEFRCVRESLKQESSKFYDPPPPRQRFFFRTFIYWLFQIQIFKMLSFTRMQDIFRFNQKILTTNYNFSDFMTKRLKFFFFSISLAFNLNVNLTQLKIFEDCKLLVKFKNS